MGMLRIGVVGDPGVDEDTGEQRRAFLAEKSRG